jgi:hypothetical protein
MKSLFVCLIRKLKRNEIVKKELNKKRSNTTITTTTAGTELHQDHQEEQVEGRRREKL